MIEIESNENSSKHMESDYYSEGKMIEDFKRTEKEVAQLNVQIHNENV